MAKELIETIIESKSIDITSSQENSSQVTAHQQFQFDIGETNRIVAKMAFNFLASDQGAEFVLDVRFDPIRDWIYTGEGENQFVSMIPTEDTVITEVIPNFPERSHCILITQIDNSIIATVSFYEESFSFIVELTNLNSSETHYTNLSGIICDWKNRSEYTLLGFLSNEHVARR